jgi:hypothetical protein
MKRFVRSDLAGPYALVAIGVLVEVLTRAGTAAAYLVALGLSAIGIGILFGPQPFHIPTPRSFKR